MASSVALRNGIATRLQTISGLRVADHPAGQVNPPAAVILPGVGTAGKNAISFDATMGRGSDDFTFTVIVMVSNITERISHDELDAYLAGDGAKSVKAAIEADGTLGGVAHFSHVTGVRNYGLIDYAGATYLGAEFLLEVTA